MIDDGEPAPTFELPAVVDGERTRIALEEYLGQEIVILAFYPGDFNPACSDESTDLDDLDLFTMQKDVTILGISGDSVHSHRAFADAYDLRIPLLSDSRGEVADSYGVAARDGAGYLTRRAVVVVDHHGRVEYNWIAEDLETLPDTEAIRNAVEGIGGDETARARYRVGHARYIEGRRTFTSAMKAFESREWMVAEGDFTRAYREFDEAAAEFDTAIRFGESETDLTYYERAERKAEALWQASEWLAESASAFASGEGREGESMREDAETPLQTARDIHEPPDPDDFPPETDPAIDETQESILPTDEHPEDISLDADIDDPAESGKWTGDTATADEQSAPERGAADGETTAGDGRPESTDDPEDSDEIDEAELEEIAAELEEQTAAITEESGEEVDDSQDHDAEDIEGEVDEEDLELDLADPTDGETDEDDTEEMDDPDSDLGSTSDDHGVPDSL